MGRSGVLEELEADSLLVPGVIGIGSLRTQPFVALASTELTGVLVTGFKLTLVPSAEEFVVFIEHCEEVFRAGALPRRTIVDRLLIKNLTDEQELNYLA